MHLISGHSFEILTRSNKVYFMKDAFNIRIYYYPRYNLETLTDNHVSYAMYSRVSGQLSQAIEKYINIYIP